VWYIFYGFLMSPTWHDKKNIAPFHIKNYDRGYEFIIRILYDGLIKWLSGYVTQYFFLTYSVSDMCPIRVHIWYEVGVYPIRHMMYQIILFTSTSEFVLRYTPIRLDTSQYVLDTSWNVFNTFRYVSDTSRYVSDTPRYMLDTI
jgi:hypothetical protein